MSSPEQARQARLARNQALFRAVNEAVEKLEGERDGGAIGGWVCECAHLTCVEQLTLTVAEYEYVRADGARFAVAPSDDHVFPEVEAVVERTDRYWTIEKEETAAAVARDADRRHASAV